MSEIISIHDITETMSGLGSEPMGDITLHVQKLRVDDSPMLIGFEDTVSRDSEANYAAAIANLHPCIDFASASRLSEDTSAINWVDLTRGQWELEDIENPQ